MKIKEHDFYDEIANWSFDDINYFYEEFTNWNFENEIKRHATIASKILDLGTAAGKKVIKNYPDCEILATDVSSEMIKTANKNLLKSKRKNITFKVMDNLAMDTLYDYFDIVTARHTIIDAKSIYKTLKKNGYLIVRGVDKLDCWKLKYLFKRGQGYNDTKVISQIDLENIIDAGLCDVELVPLHVIEYFKTKEDLLALLLKTPILDNM